MPGLAANAFSSGRLPHMWRHDKMPHHEAWTLMIAKAVAGLMIYLSVGVLYFFMHDYGVNFYKIHMGGFTARGVGIGITAELTFRFFFFTNFIVFWIPRVAVKLFLLGLMVGVILLYFLPENPVRAMFYSGLTSSMSILALASRLQADRLILRIWP